MKETINNFSKSKEYVSEMTTSLYDFWTDRDTMMKSDRERYNLVRPQGTTANKYWTRNKPKVLYDTAVAFLSAQPPRFRIPHSFDAPAEEMKKMDKSERLVNGIFRWLNYQNLNKGRQPWLRELAFWDCSGWIAGYIDLIKRNEQWEFIGDLLDPMTVYPKWDIDGLSQVARIYEIESYVAQTMAENYLVDVTLPSDYKIDFPSKFTKVVSYWCRTLEKDKPCVYNSVMIANECVKPMTLESKYTKIPIHINTIGSPDYLSDGWKMRCGENILAADRDSFDYLNAITRLEYEILEATAYPNIVTWTETGEPPFDPKKVSGHGKSLPMRLEEKIDLLKHAATPQEAANLKKDIEQDAQQGGFANIVFGNTPFEQSGFAISQLMGTIRNKLGPYAMGMEQFLSGAAAEYLRLFKYHKAKVDLVIQDKANRGQFFTESFKHAEIPEVTTVEVTLPISSPIDKVQQLALAKQAASPPRLLSKETLWDDYLDVQDTTQEQMRIFDDEISELPEVHYLLLYKRTMEKLEQAKQAKDQMSVDILTKVVESVNAALMNMKSSTSQKVGISPSELPPEMQGISPDTMNAAMGVPPPTTEVPKIEGM